MEKIFVDFHNADKQGRVRLNTNGTKADIERFKINLEEGKEIMLDDSDGLVTKGIIKYSVDEKMWVAVIDWDDLKKTKS